jgi:hypothetical protein
LLRLEDLLRRITLSAAAATTRPAPGDLLDPHTFAPDSRLFLVVHAIGVQKYTCQANGTWLFTDADAILDETTGVAKPIGTHFLSFATGRPVWQLKDGSSVEAARPQTASVSIDHDRARLISPPDASAHDPQGVRLQPAEGVSFPPAPTRALSPLASVQVDALPGT